MSIYSHTLIHTTQEDADVNFILTPATYIHTVNSTLILTSSVCISHHNTATSECSSGSVHQAVAVVGVETAAIVYSHGECWEGREVCGTLR